MAQEERPPPPKLSRNQAWRLQEELLQAFGEEEFQRRIHKEWFRSSSQIERQRVRSSLVLPIQTRVVAKYGFEASRRGVFLSAQAFSEAPLKGDVELQERNARLARLVEPGLMQPKSGPPLPGNATRVEADLRLLLNGLTVNEKIAQLLQLERLVLWEEDLCAVIRRHGIGSILSGGGSAPEPNTPEAWANMSDAFQRAALAARAKLPILYGNDSVHGQANVPGAVLLPHNIGLGCARDPELVRRCAEVTAIESRATGVHWVFAPAVSVVQDVRWGRSYEAFSDDFDLVTTLGAAAVRGYQANGTVACVKHWIGDGATAFMSGAHAFDQGDCLLTEQELRRTHLLPYLAAFRAGCLTVMASFSSVRGEKVHGSKRWLTEILKDELGFDGIVVSDWAAIDQLGPRDKWPEALAKAINAGIDVVMLPGVTGSGHHSYEEYFAVVQDLVMRGVIPMQRLDDAVARIARVKARAGLLASPFARRDDLAKVGCAEHRELAREAVRRSVVLLKNENSALPLRPGARVLLAGRSADDLGRQCGGWSVWHQGFTGNEATEGTTIREGLDVAGLRVRYDQLAFDSRYLASCDVAVAVCGEGPYAEMNGDRVDYGDFWDMQEYELLHRLRNYEKPIVLVLVCGRPLPLYDELLEICDAILVAWLPGTEGGGVADVLCGRYPPTGKLSVRWPSASEGWGTALYERGHGLTYE